MIEAIFLSYHIGFSQPAAINDSSNSKTAQLLDYHFLIEPKGEYSYSVTQSDGQEKFEESFVDGGNTLVLGSFSYTGPDGKKYSVSYSADSNGFYPSGDHIPPAASVDVASPKTEVFRGETIGAGQISSACVGSLLGCGLG